MMVKKLVGCVLGLAVLVGGSAYYFSSLEPRPADTTEARIYQGDARKIDYCTKAELDGSGLKAADIPKAFTPGCDIDQWPMPVLEGCTEPLPDGASDLRGLWQAVDGRVGHVERIEQCGDRVVVANNRFIHDFRTTGTLKQGANDISPGDCGRIRAAIRWDKEGTLRFRPWNLKNLVSRRLEDEDTLIWEYPGTTSRLKRICKIPERSDDG
jgi:hypothetical protein